MNKLIAIISIGFALCATASTQTSKEYVDRRDNEILSHAKEYTDDSVSGLAHEEDIPTKVSQLQNDTGYVTGSATNGLVERANSYADEKSRQTLLAAKQYTDNATNGQSKVMSVNGRTGNVVMSSVDVHARPDNWMPSVEDVGAQQKLVSGTNIKTVNGNSLLGSGNIEIQGGGGVDTNAVRDIAAEVAAPMTNALDAAKMDKPKTSLDEIFEFTWNEDDSISGIRIQMYDGIKIYNTIDIGNGWDDILSGDEKLLGNEEFDDAVKSSMADSMLTKRDRDDNTCRKTEFTEWTFSGSDVEDGAVYSITAADSPEYEFTTYILKKNGIRIDECDFDYIHEPILRIGKGDWLFYSELDITAARSIVCASNETYTTLSFVTNGVAAAIAANERTGTDQQIVRASLESGQWDMNVTDAGLATEAQYAWRAEADENNNNIIETYARKDEIAATNTTFSNAVLAVVIDTNTVAQIGELKQFFDELPVGTAGTSLGGVILALLGAAAYLKKKTALLENDGKASDTFATDILGKQVAISAMHYALNSGATIQDRAINLVTMTDTRQTLTLPSRIVGKTRDLILRVEVGDLATIGGIALALGGTELAAWEGDALDFAANKNYLVTVTETKNTAATDAQDAPTFFVRVVEMTSQPTAA